MIGATEFFLTRLVTGTNDIRQGVHTIENAISFGSHKVGISRERQDEVMRVLKEIKELADRLDNTGDNS